MQRGDWAGIPMPLEDRRLVIEPKYPKAQELCDIGIGIDKRKREAEIDADWGDIKIRNRFWSFSKRATVVVYEKDGRVNFVLDRGPHFVDRLMDTLDCSHAWGLEQEAKAVQTLGTKLRHHAFKAYLLTGMFMEESKRTGLIYVFRRLRPTIVLDLKGEHTKVRCCLCMHPIGYYEGTWAGAMTPTDDVIAHLMLMRGDEPMLWRRSNQHPAWEPGAGLS